MVGVVKCRHCENGLFSGPTWFNVIELSARPVKSMGPPASELLHFINCMNAPTATASNVECSTPVGCLNVFIVAL